MSQRVVQAVIRPSVMLLLTFALSVLPASPSGASAPRAARPGAESGAPARSQPSAYAPALKRLQQRLILQGAQQRMARARTLARQLRRHPGQARPGARIRRPGDWTEAGGPQGAGAPATSLRTASPLQPSAGLVPDVRVNSRAQDLAFSTVGQAEQMIASLGQNVLVAWNDGLGFDTGGNTQGYGYSVDGGLTFTDGGDPPTPAGWRWASDPVVAVNEKTGDFWYCALVDVNGTQNGVAVAKANFVANAVQWGTPTLVRAVSNASMTIDKPWLAADSLSGRLYLSYTVFGTVADTIDFQRSAVGGAVWDLPLVLSSTAEAGLVQGSRPVTGPGGEVYVTWYSIGPVDVDYMKIRKSVNQGTSFAPAVAVDSLFANFGGGAPGFNRGIGVTYPSIAVDRSSGPHRGRVYVAWNECIDFFDDDLGGGGSVAETEANDTPATADAITLGQLVTGTVSSSGDLDYFKFTGTAGQTVVFLANVQPAGFSLSLRLFCTDGTTRLALSAPGAGLSNLVCFTLPVSGTYYARCGSWDLSTGSYLLYTALDTPTPGERARDHRDVFVTFSDDGTTWSGPRRASDSPAGFDDWLPEVAVSGDNADPRVGAGRPYCIWYDWRESAAICGGGSQVYLSRSDDSGVSWTPVGALSSTRTDWTGVGSNIVPNQGDYLSLFANSSSLYAAWADGRNGDPDIYAVAVPLLTTPVQIALATVAAGIDRVTLTWRTSGSTDLGAVVERRQGTGDFAAIGEPTADGVGDLSFVDATVTPGGHYAYRLAWLEGPVRHTSGEVVVDVPLAAFALRGARPNPATRGVFVSLALPDAAPATLELLDVAGRRLGTRPVAGAGEHLVNVTEGLTLDPGVYLVRLTQGARSLTTRVTVVR